MGDFEIFLGTAPGLEALLLDEVRGKGFRRPEAVTGGVTVRGDWPDVWRANLWLRGAGQVLARVASFHAGHLAELDARARRVDWAAVLRPDVPFRVVAACRGSRIYHSGAAAERIGRAIRDALGVPGGDAGAAEDRAAVAGSARPGTARPGMAGDGAPGVGEAEAGAAEDGTAEDGAPHDGVTVTARIERDLCTISLDTSGEPLHRRGFKRAVARAPLRETTASLFLRALGYDGAEPVLDPMCGAGTFVIEAAEVAARLNPGRARRFAFEELATFDAAAWARMRGVRRDRVPPLRFHGRDRDAGAVAMSRANAARAGVAGFAAFARGTVGELVPPEGPPGLVVVNPPYGTRIGERGELAALHRALGRVLMGRFAGWRVGLVTSEAALAAATGLPFAPPGEAVPHGGLRVRLYRTGVLG